MIYDSTLYGTNAGVVPIGTRAMFKTRPMKPNFSSDRMTNSLSVFLEFKNFGVEATPKQSLIFTFETVVKHYIVLDHQNS